MPSFTLHTPDSAPEGSAERLRRIEQAWSFIPNLHRTLAESPVVLEGYDTLFGLVGRSSLTPAEQQVAFLAVSVVHGCEYCVSGHSVLATMAGLDAASIEALREGGDLPDPRQQALRRFVVTVVESRGMAGDAAVDAFLAAGFTQAQLLEVVMVVAAKTISNYVNHLTHTPLDAFMAGTAWVAPQRRAPA